MDSPGKNTGVGHHALLQGIFQTQGLNLGLLHCRQILHHLSRQESLVSWCIYLWSSSQYRYPLRWGQGQGACAAEMEVVGDFPQLLKDSFFKHLYQNSIWPYREKNGIVAKDFRAETT